MGIVKIFNKNENTSSPLHIAASTGNLEAVDIFLNNSVDINIKNFDNETPLFSAVDTGKSNLEMIKYLIKKGAKTDLKNNAGWTLLHIAVINNNLETLKYLVENNFIDIEAKDEDGYSPLFLAIENGLIDICNYLISKNANINTQDIYKSSALHLVIESENLEMIKYLIDKGIDINIKDEEGNTALALLNLIKNDAIEEENISKINNAIILLESLNQ